MRLAILGNSGSGKSTLARWAGTSAGAPVLDLDTVAWEPNQVAVARDVDAARGDVVAFCRANEHWVIEGCYADLMQASLSWNPHLIFLNPGLSQCLANCQSRPWEPHKYASRTEQDERLAYLLSWVREYYSRDGDMSLSGHRAFFSAYQGPKSELLALPQLDAPQPEILEWLR